MAVVRVYHVRSEGARVQQQPPPCPRIEPDGPRDFAHGDPGGRDPARQLAPGPRYEPLLDVRLPRQLAQQQANLVLAPPVHASRVDMEDAHGGQAGWLAA